VKVERYEKPKEPPEFSDYGIKPGTKIQVFAKMPGKGGYRQIERYSGKVVSVHPNFAVIETAKGYRVTISRFDLGKIKIERE
jgi:hypothetical protein